MLAIIPAAGQGTRLYPQTHTKPKAMVRVAGKPILGHILSNMVETDIEKVVLVVGGPMKDQIVKYVEDEFGDRFEFEYAEQKKAEGLGHSIHQAEPYVRGEPALIALGDMLFENGFETFLEAHHELNDPDASLGVKEVENPQHYGITETDEQGHVQKLVEKPDEPQSNLAISGVYIVENTELLFDSLNYLISNDIRGAGNEYQLTDALQRMVELNAQIEVFEVDNWYDCGRPQTLLEANRVLLSKLKTSDDGSVDGSVVIPPVDFGDDVTVAGSVVGPNVSADDGAQIIDSIVQDSILGQSCHLEGVNLQESLVGDAATVKGNPNRLNIGDNSSIEL